MLALTLAALLGAGALTVASAQTPTPTPNGEFLCTVANGASPDGQPCNGDEDCGAGVCVIAQGICNGGDFDGYFCGCIGGTCSAASPACDPSFTGMCHGGANATECCQPADDTANFYVANCTGGIACTGTQKLCLGGDNVGVPCITNDQCPGSLCRSTGRFCCGGDFDGFACVTNDECPSGTCDAAGTACDLSTPTPTGKPSNTPSNRTPTPVRTATATRTGGTVGPTATRTPTAIRTSGTVVPSATPTPTPTAPVGAVPRLTRAINASDLTIPVDDGSLLPISGTVRIDNEQILYRNQFNNVLTGVVRGVNGTSPASHGVTSEVFLLAAATPPTARTTPTEAANSGSIHVTGKGGGCALTDATGNPSGLGIMCAVVALVALRRKRARQAASQCAGK